MGTGGDFPFSRRRFLAHSGAALLAASGVQAAVAAEASAKRKQRLRVIAYNVLAASGWPSDRRRATKARSKGQVPERIASELALYNPDIVNFSESPSEEAVQQIADRLGMNMVRFPSPQKWPGSLLSRFEISQPENAPLVEGERPDELFTRHWGRAMVKLPSGESLVVHSAHLWPHAEPDHRLREVRAMLAAMKSDLESGRSMLLMGDLNHDPDAEEYRLWTGAGWIDSFARAGRGAGYTIRADQPRRRIDYVFAAGPIAANVLESRPLFEGAFRTNPDDPRSFALSDHVPQMAVFEIDA